MKLGFPLFTPITEQNFCPAILNGRVFDEDFKETTEITHTYGYRSPGSYFSYRCKERYLDSNMDSKGTVKCLDDGTWNSSVTLPCKGILPNKLIDDRLHNCAKSGFVDYQFS